MLDNQKMVPRDRQAKIFLYPLWPTEIKNQVEFEFQNTN